MQALEMLRKTRSLEERAESFVESTKRNIQRDVLDTLITRKLKLKDKVFSLSNFSLLTDVNSGLKEMTREDVEARFKEIIQSEYELKLLEMEIKAKTEAFNFYFNEKEVETNA